jgi:hypothetical protein
MVCQKLGKSGVRLPERRSPFKLVVRFIERIAKGQPPDELVEVHDDAAEQRECEDKRNHYSISLLRRSWGGTLPM